MRMSPLVASEMARQREAEIRGHVERTHRERAVATPSVPIARRLVLAVVAAIPFIVAIVEAAPRIRY